MGLARKDMSRDMSGTCPSGRLTDDGSAIASLVGGGLYLSNSIFPLETIIFLERFPLERERFFISPAYVCVWPAIFPVNFLERFFLAGDL